MIALNALAALLVATPAIGYVLSPLLRRRSGQWVAIEGSLPGAESAARTPRPVVYRYRDERGYRVEEIRRTAYLVRDGDEFIVLSPVCTHLGCNVAFNEATMLFECPCHGGKYDVSGQVVDGPPPEPLRRFETRLRDSHLEIRVM